MSASYERRAAGRKQERGQAGWSGDGRLLGELAGGGGMPVRMPNSSPMSA